MRAPAPRPQARPWRVFYRRDWTWWLRWALIVVVCYVTTAWAWHADQHPDKSLWEVITANLWDVLLWK